MSSRQKVSNLVFGIIFVFSTGLAIRLTVKPLSTTEPESTASEIESSLCPGGNGTNIEVKQWAIPYLLRHGFTESFVCNGTIDTITYKQAPPFELYALSFLSMAGIGYQAKRRRQAKF